MRRPHPGRADHVVVVYSLFCHRFVWGSTSCNLWTWSGTWSVWPWCLMQHHCPSWPRLCGPTSHTETFGSSAAGRCECESVHVVSVSWSKAAARSQGFSSSPWGSWDWLPSPVTPRGMSWSDWKSCAPLEAFGFSPCYKLRYIVKVPTDKLRYLFFATNNCTDRDPSCWIQMWYKCYLFLLSKHY